MTRAVCTQAMENLSLSFLNLQTGVLYLSCKMVLSITGPAAQ